MYYHGYMEDLAAAIARARGAAGEPPGEPVGRRPDGRGHGGAEQTWTPPIRVAVAATVGAALLALLAPTTAAESAPRAETAGLAEIDAIGVVPCGITDLVTRIPPAVDQPCLAEWWSWKHYLATLPRLP
jgi:hypothetical protein